jgi:hypothetical protein
VDYRDNPRRRERHHIKWTNFTPPWWTNFAPPLTVLRNDRRALKRIPDAMAAAVSDSVNNLSSGASANIERHFAAQRRLLDRDNADYSA